MLSPIITTLSPFFKKKSAAVQGNAVSNRLMAVVVYFVGSMVNVRSTGFPLERPSQRVEPALRVLFEAFLVEVHAVVPVFRT